MNIMLVGESGSGKDAISDILGYRRIALGDPIRVIVNTLPSLNTAEKLVASMVDTVPSDLKEVLRFYSQIPRTHKNRVQLQGIGTYLRKHQDDIWIKQAIAKVSGYNNVITDCRRVNEFIAFKALGFKAVYVDAPESIRVARLQQRDHEYSASSANHECEGEIGGLRNLCDAVVVNDGTLEDLRVEVDLALAWLNFTASN